MRAHPRLDLEGRPRRPSKRSLYRWYAAFREAGIEGFEPAVRPRIEGSRVLEPEFLDLLREQKTADTRRFAYPHRMMMVLCDVEISSDRAWLDNQFLATEERTVTKDHVTSIDGTLYEVPRHCRGRITITRHLLSERLTVRLDQRDVEIHPLDLVRNALDRRSRRDEPSTALAQPTTPADGVFDQDFAPIVDPEGNYKPEEES